MADRQMLVAKESFNGALPNGSTFYCQAGHTRIWSDHPAARRWAQFFEPVRVTDETPGDPEIRSAALSIGELRDLAKARGVALRFGMSKDAIAEAIADAAEPEPADAPDDNGGA